MTRVIVFIVALRDTCQQCRRRCVVRRFRRRKTQRAARCAKMAGAVMVGLSGVFFAGSAVTAKLAINLGAPPFQVSTVRGFVMLGISLVSMVVLRASGMHPLPVRHWLGVSWPQRGWLVLRALAGTATVGLSIASLEFLVISDANALNFVWPVFAVVVSYAVLRERVRRIELVGVFGAVLGSVLVARPSFLFGLQDAPVDPTGVAIALTGAFTMGWTVILIRKLAGQLHWTVVVLFQCLGQVVLFPLVLLVLRDPLHSSGEILFWSAATGVLASCHQILLTKGLARERVGPAAAMQSTFVLASFVLQLIATPEDGIEPLSLAGALVIASSVVLILASKKPPTRASSSSCSCSSSSSAAEALASAACTAASRARAAKRAAPHASEDPAWVTDGSAVRPPPYSQKQLEHALDDMELNDAAAMAAVELERESAAARVQQSEVEK